MNNEYHGGEETVELEDGREAGPRWAQLEEESVRNQRADVVACWCRRLIGLVVWCFVGFIFSQLWAEAWRMRNLNLLGVCMLVTASLFYVFYKRYRQIRDSGLSGVELVRALAVDDNASTRLRGVSRKARALCVDFKYDPEATFRERSPGCGFELYPPPPGDAATGGDSSLPAPAMGDSAAAEGKGEAEAEGKEGEVKEEEGKEGDRKGPSGGRRRRVRWPWGAREGGGGRGDDYGTSSDQGGAAAEADEEPPIARQQGNDANAGQPPLPSMRSEAGEPGRPSPPPTPDLEAGEAGGEGGGGGVGQVIRVSELSLSCSVCLFEYYQDEAVTLLPCSHLYHTECIDIWMRDHVDCPYCRADMNSWVTGTSGGGGVNRASRGATNSGADGSGSAASSSPARASAAAATAAAAAAATPSSAASAAAATAAAGLPS